MRERLLPYRRRLLFIGICFVALGAGLMDVAGRTQLAFWWNVSGACALIGTLLTMSYLLTGGNSDAGVPNTHRPAPPDKQGKPQK